jgi:hypothetical protein
MDILDLLERVRELHGDGDYADALTELEKLWQDLPLPKESVSNSFIIVSYGVVIGLKVGDLDAAYQWAQRGLIYSGNFNFMGESEFMAGEVAFAMGDLEAAKSYFEFADRVSGKRLFEGKDAKYRELVAAHHAGPHPSI